MPASYFVDRELRFVRETWTGAVAVDEVARTWRAILGDPVATAFGRSLLDARGVEILFSGADLKGLVEAVLRPGLRGRAWRSAVVVDRPVNYGMTRQFQVFADALVGADVFSDPARAQEWLLGDDQRVPPPA